MTKEELLRMLENWCLASATKYTFTDEEDQAKKEIRALIEQGNLKVSDK
jgi:hypothetical protein